MRPVSPGKSAVPHLDTHTSGQSRLASVSPDAFQSNPRNYAKKHDAKSQELANAGMIAHARCDSAQKSVSLGFIKARTWACEDWAPPAGAAMRVFFGGGVIGVFPVAALRALDTVASTGGPPGACASFVFFQILQLGILSCVELGVRSRTSFLTHENRRGLKDFPRLLDCMCQVLWWLTCVWVPEVFDDPCQSFQDFDQAHVDMWNWHDRQRGFLHEHLQVCLGLHHLLQRLLEIILGLLQRLHRRQRDEIGPALGPSSVPRVELVSSPSPAAAPRSPRCEGTLRAAPMLWLVPAVAWPAQEPGPVPLVCCQDELPLHPAVAKPQSVTTR